MDRNVFIQALAQIKQVRTVLSGLLDATAVIQANKLIKEQERRLISASAPPENLGLQIESDDEEVLSLHLIHVHKSWRANGLKGK
jgi:hypothetical protein